MNRYMISFESGGRSIRWLVIAAAGILTLLVIRGCKTEEPGPVAEQPLMGESEANANYGTPNKITLNLVSNEERKIAFGIIADTHVDATSCTQGNSRDYNDNNSWKMSRNRQMIADLNRDCTAKTGAPFVDGLITSDCQGVVHLGDMVHGTEGLDGVHAQQLIAFRQLYENDYTNTGVQLAQNCGTGDSQAYSLGYRCSFPVIPILGNHDVPSNFQAKASGYLEQRIADAQGILSSYASTGYRDRCNFIWRWGKYVFVTLGLWAGSVDWEPRNFPTDVNKLIWLQNWLRNPANRVREDSLGILIFQHYGWDGQSGNYWNTTQKQQLINILCGRDYNQNDGPNIPYNVLGIFSGHIHWPQQWYSAFEGTDISGKYFKIENFSMLSSGATGDHREEWGFSVVRLTGEEMYIHTKEKYSGQYWPVTKRTIKIGASR